MMIRTIDVDDGEEGIWCRWWSVVVVGEDVGGKYGDEFVGRCTTNNYHGARVRH